MCGIRRFPAFSGDFRRFPPFSVVLRIPAVFLLTALAAARRGAERDFIFSLRVYTSCVSCIPRAYLSD